MKFARGPGPVHENFLARRKIKQTFDFTSTEKPEDYFQATEKKNGFDSTAASAKSKIRRRQGRKFGLCEHGKQSTRADAAQNWRRSNESVGVEH